jgi:hypothetical protein
LGWTWHRKGFQRQDLKSTGNKRKPKKIELDQTKKLKKGNDDHNKETSYRMGDNI